jgi:hypothetical protein
MPSYLKGKVLWFDTGQAKGGSHTDTGPASGQDRSKSVQVTKPHSFNINMTAEQAMKQFAAMSQNDPLGFAAFQKELAASGFFGSATKVYGGWNGQTETAIADAMSQYLKVSEGAGVALSFRDFLSHQAAANTGINGGGGGSGSGSGLPSTPTLADPDTLKLAAQKAAQAALGRNLSAGELSNFVDQFHAEQTSAYQSALKGQGTNVDKTDPRGSAIKFVASTNSQEFGQHQAEGYADSFLNMFLTGPSAAPNVNVDPTAVTF